MNTKLRERNIVSIPPGRHYLGDGLCLYVSPDGQIRRWIHRYTSPVRGKVTETGLGPWPVVTLEDAKAKLLEHRRLIRSGVDPVQSRRAERQAGVTFLEAADKFFAAHQSSWSKSNIYNVKHMLFVYGKALHDVPIGQLTPDLVREALAPIAHMESAQRALALWKRVLEDAGCHLHFKLRNRVNHEHFAAMSYSELPGFMQKLRTIDSPRSAALQFVILTATPTKEVLNIRREDIDFTNRIWSTVRFKTNQPFRVPLSSKALALLDDDWHGQAKLAPYRLLRQLDPTATVHGFRSTFRDWGLEQTEYDFNLLEMCLQHSVGNAVTRAYLRGDALEKRRIVMDAWAEYCG